MSSLFGLGFAHSLLFHKWMTLTKQKLVTLDRCPRSQTAELKRRTMTLLSAQPANYFCSCLTFFSPHLGRSVCCSLLNVNAVLFSQAPAISFCLETRGKSGMFKYSNKDLDSGHNDFGACLVSSRAVTGFTVAKSMRKKGLWQTAASSSWKGLCTDVFAFLLSAYDLPAFSRHTGGSNNAQETKNKHEKVL